MNTSNIINGIIFSILFLGTVATAQFVQPTGNPLSVGSNAAPPLNTSSVDQIKEGDLAVQYFTGIDSLCMGGDCITSLWPTGPLPSTCKLEVKRWRSYNNSNVTPGIMHSWKGGTNGTGGIACDELLMPEAREDGWVSTSYDECVQSAPDGDPNSGCVSWNGQCHFVRLICTGSVIVEKPEYDFFIDSWPNFDEFPLTGAMTGDPYAFFMRRPQCNDGIDQPNPDADTAIDFPADPQCTSYADNDETN